MNEESLFAAALAKGDAAERQAFLDQACAGDLALRQRVEQLLAADQQSAGILERGPDDSALRTRPEKPALAADRVFAGRFKLRQKLGEGGMGEVWVADQTEPVQRRVALKVVRPGLDSARMLARFDQERQALALMDHPNIAKVLDAGATEGQPYFVMELIKGVSITQYCDAAKLPPRERLELFIPVCQAVQHAHQKGIIHRDLKPSNILVAQYDSRPVPKVIDFGVAKATGPRLTEHSVYTEVGSLIGTLEYMSPEQAELNNLDIDTRSDIYALGAILYELLTGSVPFSRKELQAAAFTEMLRIIKEVEPPKPSTKLSGSGTLPSVAAQRHTEPQKLIALIRGELDWIVIKCLEKDRNRRYETANGLAQDLQRYLADEVVEARAPSGSYRLQKFLRRNKGPVLTVSTILLLLLGGIVGTTLGLLAARQQRDAAEAARRDEAREKDRAVAAEKLASNRLTEVQAEKQRADEERAVAQAVNDFVQKDLLGQADVENQPGGAGVGAARDPSIRVRTVLDRAAKTLEARFANQPRVEAAIRLTLAKAYDGLGEEKEAQVHAEHSVALRTAHLGADHADTLSSKHVLAVVYFELGFHERAEALFRDVLEKRLATLGPDHPDTLNSKEAMADLYANWVLGRTKYDLAEPLLREVVQTRESRLGARDPFTLRSKVSLAWLHRLQGKFNLAEAELIELVKVYESALGQDHPGTLDAKFCLGLVYSHQGKYAQAEPFIREVLQKRIALFGPSHPATLNTKLVLGTLTRNWGKHDQAVPMLENAVEEHKAILGETHPMTLFAMGHLGYGYLRGGKPELAMPLFEHILAKYKEKPPLDGSQTLGAMDGLALTYLAVAAQQAWFGQEQEWAATCERGLSLAQDTKTRALTTRVAQMCSLRPSIDDKRHQAALLLARRAVELGKGHPQLAWSQMAVGMAEYRSGHFAEADTALGAALKAGKRNPYIAGTSAFYRAMSLFRQGKRDEARQLATQAAATTKPLPKDDKNPLAGGAIHDDLILWLAYKEAKDLIQFDAAPLPERKSSQK
jgi:non-specific serine/threonine protein kinase/serine/threonine-protein kinase